MKNLKFPVWTVFTLALLAVAVSCKEKPRKRTTPKINYEALKDSLKRQDTGIVYDSSNLFDADMFTPGVDSLETLLNSMDARLRRDLAVMEQMDSMISHLKRKEQFTKEEKEKIRENIRMLDSFLVYKNPDTVITCKGKDCLVYAEVIKSSQTLYLYIEGELKDSFKVSTGIKKYETPSLDVRPAGPLFTKYTSRKFPGGDYQGLGNMPYAVFVRGGYAIHGTTPGNFSKLGTKASHGCIRLHPDNARIFYELVKTAGLGHTWVRIRETAPVE